jgi:hypothetical protein
MPRVILPLTMGWFLVCGFLLAVGWSKTITATNVPVVLSKHVAGINDAGVLAYGGQNPGDILFANAEEEFETFLNCDDSAEPQREEAMHDAEQDRDQEKSEAELQQELQQIDETLQDRDICGMRIYTLMERRQTIIKEFHRRSDPTPLQGAVAARGIEGLTDAEAVLLEEVAPEHTCQLIAQSTCCTALDGRVKRRPNSAPMTWASPAPQRSGRRSILVPVSSSAWKSFPAVNRSAVGSILSTTPPTYGWCG